MALQRTICCTLQLLTDNCNNNTERGTNFNRQVAAIAGTRPLAPSWIISKLPFRFELYFVPVYKYRAFDKCHYAAFIDAAQVVAPRDGQRVGGGRTEFVAFGLTAIFSPGRAFEALNLVRFERRGLNYSRSDRRRSPERKWVPERRRSTFRIASNRSDILWRWGKQIRKWIRKIQARMFNPRTRVVVSRNKSILNISKDVENRSRCVAVSNCHTQNHVDVRKRDWTRLSHI